MLMTDIIAKKRDGEKLNAEEIQYFINGYTNGDIPDYQMSALLMAILLKGMDREETLNLTMAMMHSGETLDLSGIDGVIADKHSTGGVGDKTSLILCPMVAACGVKIAKMSGRGLGHTGGTIDKLESFAGFDTGISDEEFIENVNKTGISIIGQTANLDPADKKMYALRDVTATVPSVPLIVSSIMSKKLASGADIIVLDVKAGAGSFMKNEEEARELATELVEVGKRAGKKTVAVITDMDEPLGYAIGNALEVEEAIEVLNGEDRGELSELCLELGACILTQAQLAENEEQAKAILQKSLVDGSALNKLAELVKSQGGCPDAVYNTELLPKSAVQLEVPSLQEGYVEHIAADGVGLISMQLGGGRATKESEIDLSVGVVLNKKVADAVKSGESLGTVYAKTAHEAQAAAEKLRECYKISSTPVIKPKFIKGIIK